MREMIKRIVLVIFVLLVLTAISGFFYMQKNPLDGKTSINKTSNLSGNHLK
ncbi:hypothetical protein SAMN05421639_10457 [Chryseobacterium shigense]|uniref:Uncharacterized protein n=1 Tax=Chryseobacterium shigense TaxID=297244 RepID=A0A1N7IJM6_9FLAO|nr:hypothetical protein [Chryseobacterium shigense]SIS37267.1 hypothetical protein SAMN05421639_10457 [Chryseobacterium shigense]